MFLVGVIALVLVAVCGVRCMCKLNYNLLALCSEHRGMGICMGTAWIHGVEYSVSGRGGVRGGVVKMQVHTAL